MKKLQTMLLAAVMAMVLLSCSSHSGKEMGSMDTMNTPMGVEAEQMKKNTGEMGMGENMEGMTEKSTEPMMEEEMNTMKATTM